ncbi:MAG: hypothetical protein ACJ8AW_22705 [Rhodopila sp.]
MPGLIAITATAGWFAYRQMSVAPDQPPSTPTAETVHPLRKNPVRITSQTDNPAFLAVIAELQRSLAIASPAQAGGGDERLPVAFDLLHANKLAAATRLLEAIGADRLSRARAERVDAIIAYRLLGNIADTPQQALAAFARAIEIDSNDVESLLGSGWITLQQDLPGEAERRFRRALPLLAGDAQPWNRFRVRLGLGSIREQHGELPDALTFYHEAVAIGEQQARSAPGDTSWRRALSIAYEKVCDAHAAQGSLAEALDAYRSALALVDRLQQFEPGRPTWQHPMPGLSIPVCQSRSAVCWLLEPIGRPPWWPMPTRLRWPSPSPNRRPDPIPATGYGKASWQRVTRRLAMSASR